MAQERAWGRADALKRFGLGKLAADSLFTSFPMPGAKQVGQQAAGAAHRVYNAATSRLTHGKGALLGLLAGGAILGARKSEPTYTLNPSSGYAPIYP